MKKLINKLIVSLLGIMIILNMPMVNASQKDDIPSTSNQAGALTNPGDVMLTRTISLIDSDKGIYNVQIDISSKNAIDINTQDNPLYLVIVLDSSSSMYKRNIINYGNTYENIKEGVIQFSRELLNKFPNINIALVNFSTDAKVVRNFQNKELDNSLFTYSKGSSNIAKGLDEARELLLGVEENAKKYIVLLSDGEPREYTNWNSDIKAINETVLSSLNIIDDNIELYAVGCNAKTKGIELLKQIVTIPDTKYYISSNNKNIITSFDELINKISSFPAFENAVFTDILPDNFEYVNDDSTEVRVNGNTITYEIDVLNDNHKTFNYNIIIDPKSKTGWHCTSKSIYLAYTNNFGEEKLLELDSSFSNQVFWETIKYQYTVNYYIDNPNKDNLVYSIKDIGEYNSEINLDLEPMLEMGYVYNGEITSFILDSNNKEIDIVYTKKTNLSYCVNYFYDGIIDINKTECYSDITYGTIVDTFTDNRRDGYILDYFETITIVDDENFMNVFYRSLAPGEVIPPNTGIKIK